jgi:hypothetical protein
LAGWKGEVPMAEYFGINRRLVMRYEKGTYTFNRIRFNSGDQAIHNLAKHISDLQNEKPAKVLKVTTFAIVPV